VIPTLAGKTWYQLVASGGVNPCLPQAGALNQAKQTGITAGGPEVPLAWTSTGSCDPSVVQQGAAAGGYTITNAQANTLACIAKYESNCGKSQVNYAWKNGSSAAGAFQVLMQSNSICYDNPACTRAVGATGALNCKSGLAVAILFQEVRRG
jgi:hypothetical protein